MKHLNGRVYKIICSVNDIVYIGSTFNTLRDRFRKHASSSQCVIYNHINELGKDKFKIILIKEYQVVDRMHLQAFEQLWINKTKCINKNNSFCISKQYQKHFYLKNREYKKSKANDFRLNNPDYNKKYYSANKKRLNVHKKRDITCNVCNKIMKFSSYYKHIKSKNHEKTFNTKNAINRIWNNYSEVNI
jgi:hypothetical protein